MRQFADLGEFSRWIMGTWSGGVELMEMTINGNTQLRR